MQSSQSDVLWYFQGGFSFRSACQIYELVPFRGQYRTEMQIELAKMFKCTFITKNIFIRLPAAALASARHLPQVETGEKSVDILFL